MLKTFEELKKNFKLSPQSYSIDNGVFKLHYRFTTLIFFVAAILVSSRQYIGEHIRCISDKGIPEHVLNTYCFFTPTFTVNKHMNASLLDRENLAHPGVGPYGQDSPEPIKRHSYYQWVPFVLFGQGCMFMITHLLWKKFEGGRLKILADNLRVAAFALTNKEISTSKTKIYSKDERDRKIEFIRRNFVDRRLINSTWAMALIFCEVLNIFHIVLQFYITDAFLDHQFESLGVDIYGEGFDSNVDVLDRVFPKVTKCTFHKYGPSGSIQFHDALCVMALNIINDKIYTFLWFWFVIIFAASIAGVLWRLLTLLLHARSRKFNQIVFGASCPGKLNPFNLLTVTKHCSYADWLFLKYLAGNVDGLVFREIFIGLAEELEERDSIISDDFEDAKLK